MPESVKNRPTRSHEFIFLFSKQPHYFYDQEAIKEPCLYDVDGTETLARKARSATDLKSHPSILKAGIRPGGFKDAKKFSGKNKQRGHARDHSGFQAHWDHLSKKEQCSGMRNKRDVWSIAPAQYAGTHGAIFPPDLVKPCVLSGSRPGDTVLDPFGGSGTTGMVAIELGRRAILIELNPEYAQLCHERCNVTLGLALSSKS